MEHLDPSFGMGSIVTTNLGDTRGGVMPSSSSPMASWWRPEAGVSLAGGSRHFALARYLADGRLDATFGTGFKMNVNAVVIFEPISSTITFRPDPTGCPEGFVETFGFDARLTNIREGSRTDLVVPVTTLT